MVSLAPAPDSGDSNPDSPRKENHALRADEVGASEAITFDRLAPGRYAVIVFHDENADGRLEKSLLGIPEEGYGFSNGASGFLGPPGFDAAAFDLKDGGLTVRIRIAY